MYSKNIISKFIQVPEKFRKLKWLAIQTKYNTLYNTVHNFDNLGYVGISTVESGRKMQNNEIKIKTLTFCIFRNKAFPDI